MIRSIMENDFEVIKEMLAKEFKQDKVNEIIKSIKAANKTYVYIDPEVRGFVSTSMYDKQHNRWNIDIFVDPSFRNKGIGKQLYVEMRKFLAKVKPEHCTVTIDSRNDSYKKFMIYRGFDKYYGLNIFSYNGPKKEDINLNFVPFEDKYIDKYIELGQVCFHDVRKANNIEPYTIIKDQNYINYINSYKDKIYLLIDDNDEIISTFTLGDNDVDHFMVSPKYQGQHYGRRTMIYAMNKLFDIGVKTIYLSVLEINDKASNLYTSLGFKIDEKIEVYRLIF